jgi:hypothetical protein
MTRIVFGKCCTRANKRCKLIRKVAITYADVAYTALFESLRELGNAGWSVCSDSSYPSIECEARLKRARRGVYVQRRGHATHCMPRRRNDTTVQLSRRTISRAYVWSLGPEGGNVVRCLEIARTTLVRYLKAASYKLKWVVSLKERSGALFEIGVCCPCDCQTSLA